MNIDIEILSWGVYETFSVFPVPNTYNVKNRALSTIFERKNNNPDHRKKTGSKICWRTISPQKKYYFGIREIFDFQWEFLIP